MVASIAASQGRLARGRPEVQASSNSRSIDLGEIEPDAEARHTFTLTNTTASTLEILGVHTSCGCELAAVRVGEQIGPGSEPGRLSFLVHLKENPPVGMTMDYLTLEFENRPEATLNVPVIAAVDTAASVLMSSADPVTSSPALISLPTSAPAAPLALPKEIE